MSYLIDPHHPAMVELLARLFPEPEEAGIIVERAGFQRGAIPLFRLAEDFWNRVMHDAANGRNHGGVRAVLEQAVKRCPHNPALGEHLRRVRSLGSSTSAAAPGVMGAGLTGKIGTTRRDRGASRAKSKPPTAAEPAPAGEPFHYRTYNCIVGPDEPDAGTRTNQKGECSASDRRVFHLP